MEFSKTYPVVRNKYLRLYLHGYDLLADLLSCRGKKKAEKSRRKILLRNPAAYGDVLYTLRLVRAMKAADPSLYIGLLVGSWTVPLVKECRDIDAIHIEDHWAIKRSQKSKKDKIEQWLTTRAEALAEIKKQKYDIAIDLYYYFPSAALLFWQAGIPERIGYDSHEGKSLYTKHLHWRNEDIHNVEYQARLVDAASIKLTDLTDTAANISFPQQDTALLNQYGFVPKKYVVISVGTGGSYREWPVPYWHELIRKIETAGILNSGDRIILVGAGNREQECINKILSYHDLSLTVSICNKLSIPQLMQVIRNAKLFIGLESFNGHIAAMFKVPQVSIMHGATNLYQWKPYANPNCVVVRTTLPCSPCYFPSHCQHDNACMNLSPDSVFEKVKELLLQSSL